MRVTVVFACLLVGSAAIGQSPQCGMSRAFDQLDQDGQSKIAVWNDGPGAALLFADTMNINTDGTRRSYSVDDFWGENHALNNLCNAMSDKCAGLTSDQMRDRRIATQKAKADGWPRAATNATRISKSIISFKGGKPCPEIDGYLVSATALHKARIINPCDISNYADALTVPSIVLPQRAKESIPTLFEAAGAKLGDLVVTMSADGRLIHYAVVGDSGPSKSLGEVSLALASELNGRRLPPDNYLEVRGRKPYVGKGWHVGRPFTLILTRTRDAANPYMTRERIEKAAAEWFAKWGGDGRLKACSAMYRS